MLNVAFVTDGSWQNVHSLDELDFFPDPSSYYDNDDYYNGGRGADDYDTDDEEFV